MARALEKVEAAAAGGWEEMPEKCKPNVLDEETTTDFLELQADIKATTRTAKRLKSGGNGIGASASGSGGIGDYCRAYAMGKCSNASCPRVNVEMKDFPCPFKANGRCNPPGGKVCAWKH